MSYEPDQYHTGLWKYNNISNDVDKYPFSLYVYIACSVGTAKFGHAPTQIYVIKKVYKVYNRCDTLPSVQARFITNKMRPYLLKYTNGRVMT